MKTAKADTYIGKEFNTKDHGECFIISYKSYNDVKVMYYDGVIVKTTLSKLRLGQVGRGKPTSWYGVGTRFETNFNGECEVIAVRGTNDIDVRFDDGTVVKTRSGSLKRGEVKNPNTPKIFGVATNDLENMTHTKVYTKWHSMIRRCYSSTFHKTNPAYIGVTVQPSWLIFSNLKRDVENLPFFSCCETDNYELDKDILADGSRMYKLETISFVPKEINTTLVKDIRSGKYKGYAVNQHGNYSVSTHGELDAIRKELGLKYSHRNKEDATSVYKQSKAERMRRLAEKYKGMVDDRVYEKLQNYDFELETNTD